MTALRELAERWKARASNAFGFHAAKQCADELLSILDAEGDGGAVAEIVVDRGSGGRVWFDIKVFDRTIPHGTKLYIHPQPVRSGVVSDEIAESACSEALRKYRADCPNCEIDGADFDAGFYAALEHFAKSQGESNV